MSRAIGLCALIAVSTAAPAMNLEPDATEEPAADPDPADAAPPDGWDVQADPYGYDEDPIYIDQESDYDEESKEYREEERQYKQYLNEERDKMMNDPTYRDDLIEELIEEFPGGLASMGVQEKSLYDLAMHMQAQELRVGKLRTKMDEAEERMVRKKRRNAKRMHNDKIGLKELSPEELKELLSSEPSQEEQARMQRRRRQAFLQREAGRLLNIRKNVALELDLDAKAALVQEHTDAVQELGKKLGHAPGHKKQLQDLWEKEDGLIGIRFNPKTFFKLHDMNDDSFFDQLEIQALMMIEAQDLHTHNGKVDLLAVKEEAHRMAEQMMSEYDDNHDGLIGYPEFLTFSEGEGYIDDRNWHAINPEQELLDAMMGDGAKDLSTKDLNGFRQNPIKWLRDKTGLN